MSLDINDEILNNKNIFIMITGTMGSGKSEILLRYYNFFLNNNYKQNEIISFINNINDKNNKIISRNINFNPINAIPINKLIEINQNINNDNKILIIDEFQFFNDDNSHIILYELKSKFDYILVSGLNRDFNSNLFGQINRLLFICDIVHFLNSKCELCNNKFGNYNYKINNSDYSNIIDINSKYISLCFSCFYINDERSKVHSVNKV